MKTSLFNCLLVVLLVSFTGCSNKGKGVLTPTSSALPYELLIVMDANVQNSKAGNELIKVLTSDVPGLPQSESAFKLMKTEHYSFDGILKPIRNIVIVNIDKQYYTKASILIDKDVYSYPQNILTINSPDIDSAAVLIQESASYIVKYFTDAEMMRQIAILDKNFSDLAMAKIKEKFNCEVKLPADLSLTKDGQDFYMLGSNAADVDRYFIMYSLPYTDKNSFTREYFLHKRDSVLAINVPGEKENMYMTTDWDFTEVKDINLQGTYALEARGLWKIENDFMGGPFVSHMRLDEVNNRLIFSEVFVYAPSKLKRNLMRSIEASLYTVKLPASKVPSEN